MSTELPHTIRQNPLTDEVKQIVQRELNELAVKRDMEVSKFAGAARITEAGGNLKPSVLQALAGLVRDGNSQEVNAPVVPRGTSRGHARV